MREIKFRVWDKEHKEMIYEPIKYELEVLSRVKGDLSWKEISWIGFSPMEWKIFEIMQYTTKKDINDKDIYKDDIVKSGYSENNEWKECLAIIKWDDEDACWVQDMLDGSGTDQLLDVPCEVIGNIHENTELLK